MKILAIHLKRFIDYAELRGISKKELLTAMKTQPSDFNDPDSKVDAADFYAVVNLISKFLNDDLLGLRVGNHLNLNTLGAIYKISLKATTNQEALFYCQDYLRKTFPLIKIVNSFNASLAMIELSSKKDDDPVNRIILETILTIVAREIKIISGEDTDLKIFSPFHSADYPSDWDRGDSFAVKFKQTILKASLQDNSKWGLDILIPEYLKLITSMKPEKSFHNKIKIAALHMARPTLPDLAMVASAFNLTDRTFQRRLVKEGVTFRQVNEGLKKEISELLIRHHRFSVADISYLLGYAEPASFIHSFKKWYGVTPKSLRQKITA